MLGCLCRRAGLCSWRALPAGTGKTVVGFHIVFWFHKSNEEQAMAWGAPGEKPVGAPCILYCGPSNKSVDVLAGALGWFCGGFAQGCWPQGKSLMAHCHQDCC